MKKIDSGLQYDVYEISRNRVLKIPRPNFAMIRTMLIWWPKYYFRPFKLIKELRRYNLLLNDSIRGFKKRKIPRSLTGNSILNGKVIRQDKLIPLKDLMPDYGNFKNLFQDYAKLIVELWKYGVQEITFNFAVNYGINKKGKVVLMDLGELAFDKEEVAKYLSYKKWERCYSFRHNLNKKQKIIYSKIMEKNLTLKKLNSIWGSKLKD